MFMICVVLFPVSRELRARSTNHEETWVSKALRCFVVLIIIPSRCSESANSVKAQEGDCHRGGTGNMSF